MNDDLETETGLDAMTKAELKAEARARGLPTSGTKAALLERVEEHDRRAGNGDDGGQAPSAPDDRGEAEREPEAREEPEGGEPEDGEGEPEAREEPEGEKPDEGDGEPEAREAEPGERAGDEPEPEPEAEAEAEEGEAEPEAREAEPEEREETEETEQREAEDREAEPTAREKGEGEPTRKRRDGAGIDIAEAASAAARALADLTGRSVDAVSGVRPTDDGFQVTIEVLELSRVPSTTDVLATYEVGVAADGGIVDYARSHRYYRNQTSRE